MPRKSAMNNNGSMVLRDRRNNEHSDPRIRHLSNGPQTATATGMTLRSNRNSLRSRDSGFASNDNTPRPVILATGNVSARLREGQRRSNSRAHRSSATNGSIPRASSGARPIIGIGMENKENVPVGIRREENEMIGVVSPVRQRRANQLDANGGTPEEQHPGNSAVLGPIPTVETENGAAASGSNGIVETPRRLSTLRRREPTRVSPRVNENSEPSVEEPVANASRSAGAAPKRTTPCTPQRETFDDFIQAKKTKFFDGLNVNIFAYPLDRCVTPPPRHLPDPTTPIKPKCSRGRLLIYPEMFDESPKCFDEGRSDHAVIRKKHARSIPPFSMVLRSAIKSGRSAQIMNLRGRIIGKNNRETSPEKKRTACKNVSKKDKNVPAKKACKNKGAAKRQNAPKKRVIQKKRISRKK